MKKITLIVCSTFLIALSSASFLYFSSPANAQRNVATRFEYAVINGSYAPYPADSVSVVTAAVNVCYLQTNGCQNEEIKSEVNISKFLQDERLENSTRVKRLAQERADQTSFSRAIAKLGSEGWELIAPPAVEFDLYYLNQQGIQTVNEGAKTERQHVWFKRARQ